MSNMRNKAMLACDFGASSGRIILGTLKNKKIELKEMYRFENRTIIESGFEVWDFSYLFNEMKKGLKKIFHDKDIKNNVEILGIGIDTWGVDYGYITKDKKILSNPICYRDSRTKESIIKVHNILSKEKLFKKTGIQFNEFNTIYQIYHDIVYRDILNKNVEKVLFMPNLFEYFLTGVYNWEQSIASTSSLLDKNGNWDEEIFEKLSIPKQLFGEISRENKILGILKKEIADELEIPRIKVYTIPNHDSAVAALGSLAKNKDFYIINGTWSILGTISEKSILSEEAYKNKITNEIGSNGNKRVLKMFPGLYILQKLKKYFKTIDYPQFADLAKKSTINSYIDLENEDLLHSDDIVKNIKEYIDKTNQKKPKNKEDIIKIAYNSLIKKYYESIIQLEEILGYKANNLIFIGGGIQDKYLIEEISKKISKNVIVGEKEASAYGNILSQFMAEGIIKKNL